MAPELLQQVLLVVGTAILSSALTWLSALLLFRWKLKERLKAELDELGDAMKERLRAGVLEAGRELKPEFRDEVREGFKEALASAMAGDLIEQSAKQAVQKGSTIVESGLRFLMGNQGRPGEK